MKTLREIVLEIAEATERGDEEAVKALVESQAKKIDSCVSFIRWADHQGQWLDEEIESLKREKKKLEMAADRLKDFAKSLMEREGVTSLVGEKGHKFSLSKTEVVEVDSVSALPDHLRRQKITVEPDKVAIKEAIKAGEIVDGARLIEKTYVRVK